MHVRPPSAPFSTYIVKVRIQSRGGGGGPRAERDRKRINIPAICMRGGALVRIDVAARVQGLTGIFALIQSDGMRPPRINIFRIIRLCLR